MNFITNNPNNKEYQKFKSSFYEFLNEKLNFNQTISVILVGVSLIYFLIMILMLGTFDNVQGPRHRVQFDGITALFQFYGGIGLLRQVLPSDTCLGRQSTSQENEVSLC